MKIGPWAAGGTLNLEPRALRLDPGILKFREARILGSRDDPGLLRFWDLLVLGSGILLMLVLLRHETSEVLGSWGPGTFWGPVNTIANC